MNLTLNNFFLIPRDQLFGCLFFCLLWELGVVEWKELQHQFPVCVVQASEWCCSPKGHQAWNPEKDKKFGKLLCNCVSQRKQKLYFWDKSLGIQINSPSLGHLSMFGSEWNFDHSDLQLITLDFEEKRFENTEFSRNFLRLTLDWNWQSKYICDRNRFRLWL